MSRFSQTLQSVIDTRGAALRLAEQSGIAASILSRLARGTSKQPSFTTLAQLMPVLSPRERERLLTAWMLDYMPTPLRQHLLVITDETARVGEMPDSQDPAACTPLDNLTSTMQATIQRLAQLCLDDEEFARMLYLCTRQWDPEWSAALDRLGVAELANHFGQGMDNNADPATCSHDS